MNITTGGIKRKAPKKEPNKLVAKRGIEPLTFGL